MRLWVLMFMTGCVSAAIERPVPASLPLIHTVTGSEQGLFVNGYLIEAEAGVVAVDSALTVSDGRALRAKLDALGKPLAGVLLTHAHPDHYNGVAALIAGQGDVPVYATSAVRKVIERDDAAKNTQWQPVFGPEWPSQRSFPNRELSSGASLSLAGMELVVHDLGAGESHADSYWELRGPLHVAFIGDVVLYREHAYTNDGHTRAWLDHLAELRQALTSVTQLYPGHGPAGDASLLEWQADYLTAYRAAVQELRLGRRTLDDAAKARLVERMKAAYPDAGLDFMIALGADAVAAELADE